MFTRYETLELGSAPSEEDCVQVNSKTDYSPAMKAECKRFQDQLLKRFPWLVGREDIKLIIKGNPHDAGTYYEVCLKYQEDTKGERLAYAIESTLPLVWNDTNVITLEEISLAIHDEND